tara:strand:- start:70 stop:486 length:417 start_codon:yes stop_codon:yes gene_type:complete
MIRLFVAYLCLILLLPFSRVIAQDTHNIHENTLVSFATDVRLPYSPPQSFIQQMISRVVTSHGKVFQVNYGALQLGYSLTKPVTLDFSFDKTDLIVSVQSAHLYASHMPLDTVKSKHKALVSEFKQLLTFQPTYIRQY